VDKMMKPSLSAVSSPYLARPLRSLEQVRADQDEKKVPLKGKKITRHKPSISNQNKNQH